ncbi:hypothetical protein NDU88_006135 [Pleurodeles waltl]|uniref:Uncharacterized protein n=1 Tax=Pleurodeles waltl TaxID=8319 RepID=A0AAV7TD09_PLEWA|nr:hypothetical protein NDU88_006135 [Pleurodeles waltl]
MLEGRGWVAGFGELAGVRAVPRDVGLVGQADLPRSVARDRASGGRARQRHLCGARQRGGCGRMQAAANAR